MAAAKDRRLNYHRISEAAGVIRIWCLRKNGKVYDEDHYYLDAEGDGHVFTKFGTDFKESYHVRGGRCDCLGAKTGHRCKHVQAIAKLKELGRI